MAEKKKQQAPKVQILSNDMEKNLERMGKAPVPDTWKMSRDVGHKIAGRQLELFTDNLDPDMTPDGTIISTVGIEDTSKMRFREFTQAVAQILYNQSVQSGHETDNTGIEKVLAKDYSDNYAEKTGKYEKKYAGIIIASLYEICQKGFGVIDPSTKQKREMQDFIDKLDNIKLEIRYPNGDIRRAKICTVMEEYIRNKDGARLYKLQLHPVFSEQIGSNYALHPQDIMKRLSDVTKRRTAAHLILLDYLAMQDKKNPCKMTGENFLTRTELKDSFKINKKRTMKQVVNICEAMKAVRMVKEFQIIPQDLSTFKEVIFTLDPDYVRPVEEKGK